MVCSIFSDELAFEKVYLVYTRGTLHHTDVLLRVACNVLLRVACNVLR